jgi:hypothetical protein
MSDFDVVIEDNSFEVETTTVTTSVTVEANDDFVVEVQEQATTVVVDEQDFIVQVDEDNFDVVAVGMQGPAGPPGPQGLPGEVIQAAQSVYYQADDPGDTGNPYVWIQDLGGGAFTVWIDDGVA